MVISITFLLITSHGYSVHLSQHFRVVGLFVENDRKQDQLVIGVKTTDPHIKYVAVGSEFERNPATPYNLTLDGVLNKLETHKVTQLSNGYGTLVCDTYNENNYTFSAFDRDGNLIADKIFGADARYIK